MNDPDKRVIGSQKAVTIPETVAGVVSELVELNDDIVDLSRLKNNRKWQVAALVAAVVQPDKGNGGRKEVANIGHFESARAFAKRGIPGLTKHDSVLAALAAWQSTGLRRPVLGEKVELPTTDYPRRTVIQPDPEPDPVPEPLDPDIQGIIDDIEPADDSALDDVITGLEAFHPIVGACNRLILEIQLLRNKRHEAGMGFTESEVAYVYDKISEVIELIDPNSDHGMLSNSDLDRLRGMK